MSYIAVSDIKSNIAQGFSLQDYILESDEEINDLAESLGIRTLTDIKTDPLHYKIKRYGVSFILMRLCQDKMGTNDVAIDTEKYLIQYGVYKKELAALKGEISQEMFTGQVNGMNDRSVFSGLIYRS